MNIGTQGIAGFYLRCAIGFAIASALVALGLLSLAPRAEAVPGIDRWWGNDVINEQTEGGRFSRVPRGVAVNWTTGDVYVVDSGGDGSPFNNRIQRFTGDGAFIAAWGAEVDGSQPGTGYEICVQAQSCKAAATSLGRGGEMSEPQGIAIDQPTGDVYVTDSGNHRVQVFSATGAFLRAFGLDVIQDGKTGDTGFGPEICTVAADCKAGVAAGTGGALNNPGYLAVAPAGAPAAGDVLVAEQTNNRIQQFTAAGAFVRTWGGGVVSGGATGTGNTTDGSRTVSSLVATSKAFAVGQVVTGAGIPPGTRVAAVTNGAAATMTLSQAATATASGVVITAPEGDGNVRVNERQKVTVTATGGTFTLSLVASQGFAAATTAPIAFNAPATDPGTPGVADSVEEALEKLPRLTGNVIVSGGPGNETGANPYIVEFDGALADTNVVDLNPNGNLLTGNPRTAVRAVLREGTGAYEVCVTASECSVAAPFTLNTNEGDGIGQFQTPSRIAADKFGNVYTVEAPTNSKNGSLRVQRFGVGVGSVTPLGEFAASALHGTASNGARDNVSEIAVDDGGDVYVVKSFPVGTGTPPAVMPPPLITPSQQRILRVDPDEEEVVEVIAANPEVVTPAFDAVRGLAVSASGTPLYATTAVSGGPFARVYRLSEISGLSAEAEEATGVGASTALLNATVTPASTFTPTRYRFEYSGDGITWIPAPVPDRDIGNGSDGGASSTCPLPRAQVCHLSQPISGLTPNRTYQVRLVAYTLYKGAQVVDVGPSFTTVPARPVVTTGTASWSSPAASSPSLLLRGAVNPGNGRTNFAFQYVTDARYHADQVGGDGFQNSATVPVPVDEAGQGLRDIAVRRVLSGLDPGLTYWYRLVATNAVGTEAGAARSVAPPNPSDRFFERLSNGDSWGAGIEGIPVAIADSGERGMFYAQAFGQPESVPGLATPFVAERGPDGWAVAEMVPDPDRAIQGLTSQPRVAADLGRMVWPEASIGERERMEARFGFSNLDGTREPASQPLAPLALEGNPRGLYKVRGASHDLTHILFSAEAGLNGSVALVPGETAPANGSSNLYEISGAGPSGSELRLVNREDGEDGAPIGGRCGAGLGGGIRVTPGILSNAVSNDGSVVYFTARPGEPYGDDCASAMPKRIFKRIDGETTVEISKSQCDRVSPACSAINGDDAYMGASATGSVAFFTSPRQLTNSDTDSTADLYVYDSEPPAGQPALVQASAGEAVSGHPVPGSGAKVLGVLDNAADGSRVYFVAEGILSGPNMAGNAPAANKGNLYVFERDLNHPTGRIAYVGSLLAGIGSGDQTDWQRGDNGGKRSRALPADGPEADGHALLFVTTDDLVSGDSDSSKDLYLYDDVASDPAESLLCLSCSGKGNFDVEVKLRDVEFARPTYLQESRIASRDLSTVVFTTSEPLLPGDPNAAGDVYAWQALGSSGCSEASDAATLNYIPTAAGCLRLISAGTDQFGVANQGGTAAMISSDGNNIFFVTQAALVGSDTNNVLDLYDARIGGGFPEQAPPAPCLGQADCLGAGAPPPTSPTPPGSGSFSGPGNPPPPPPARCGKGKVRKGGKCVKKKAKRHRAKGGNRKAKAGHRKGKNR